MDPLSLTAALKEHAADLGFSLSGACPAVEATGYARFLEWLDRGYAGRMHYLPDRKQAYRHPDSVLEGVRSLLILAMNYRTADPRPPGKGEGRIARYAWGRVDYHDLIRERLNRLADRLQQLVPGASARGVVDTAPLLERDYARLAGLGWIGKNTLLLSREAGSYFFLAALLTDQVLAYDAPHESDHCGTCRACLDACPTQAFPQPYVLDATRCISYQTIELRELFSPELRAGISPWVFGCDICQEVCPWNQRAPQSEEAGLWPLEDSNPVSLSAILELDEAAFRARFRDTPLSRPKRAGLLRSAAIALGVRPHPAAIPALIGGLGDAQPLVRQSCAWALGEYREPAAREALAARLRVEQDAAVMAEIHDSLSRQGK